MPQCTTKWITLVFILFKKRLSDRLKPLRAAACWAEIVDKSRSRWQPYSPCLSLHFFFFFFSFFHISFALRCRQMGSVTVFGNRLSMTNLWTGWPLDLLADRWLCFAVDRSRQIEKIRLFFLFFVLFIFFFPSCNPHRFGQDEEE